MSSLPDRPCFDQYRRQAKDLFQAATSGDESALSEIRRHHALALDRPKLRLTDVQQAVARREGFASWPRLKAAVIAAETLAFFDEVQKCDVEAVRRRLARLPELAKAKNAAGETALHVAAGQNDVGLAEVLVRAGADTKVRFGQSAHTALSWAITVGSYDFARELVRLGDEPDLFSAAGLGDLERVQSFWRDGHLVAGASVTGSSRFAADGSRLPRPPESEVEVISDAFVMACRNGEGEVASWLLEQGADVGFRGYIGGTCLHWAEYSGNSSLCDLLRSKGASDESEDDAFLARPRAFGVIVAAGWGLEGRLGLLLDADPSRVDIRGGFGTPLNAAAWNGQVGTARLLLSRGADAGAVNAAGLTALEVARHRGFPAVATLFE